MKNNMLFKIFAMQMVAPCALFAALLLALPAQADTGIYMGAGLGKPLGDVKGQNLDSSGFKSNSTQTPVIYGGIRVLGLFAGEVGYSNWSSEANSGQKYKSDIFTAAGMVYIPNPIPFFAFYGKLGIANSQSKFAGASASTHTPLWGAGIEFTAIPKINIRLSYDNFGKIGKAASNASDHSQPGEVKAAQTSLSLNYRFF